MEKIRITTRKLIFKNHYQFFKESLSIYLKNTYWFFKNTKITIKLLKICMGFIKITKITLDFFKNHYHVIPTNPYQSQNW